MKRSDLISLLDHRLKSDRLRPKSVRGRTSLVFDPISKTDLGSYKNTRITYHHSSAFASHSEYIENG
ncbi:hypothetical protein LEP1GSC062_0752 [Leptospira alexanderi serovar Manhao 3 str. L 60]|uniref:Uncharacterized protein n=1 Tax=Leptospira alexanderi serovar Manhao 3 str. L 60 TaxID=1049759 RepID=V6I2S6_9LEPT|nr:hypothetical protein LEP1GSC062_0752 [Leptospira alexanderi serovar Manhao 3 str. L 60]